ncbi:MAG: hypothetical protein JRM90_07485, partial [Nitrososphaerota archaeon]|nr:hypothetical protein [Nitrososphaerota archaeon]
APMQVGISIGSSVTGQEYLLTPVGTCSLEAITTCPGTTPGDIIALTLENLPQSGVSGVTSTTTVTSTSTATSLSVSTTTLPGQTVTSTLGNGTVVTRTLSGSTVVSTYTLTSSSGGVSSTTLYGVAAVAVIFIITTGYLASKGRKPAP